MSYLFVSAAGFELKPFIESVPHAETYEFGIGALKTESRSAQICEKTKDRDVIYVGTCGVLGPWERPYLASASKVSWLPLCERVERSWSLPEMPAIPLQAFESLPAGHVLCTTHISKDSEISSSVSENYGLNSDVHLYENLELYSFARHARHCRSLRVLLGVSNQVCEEGRQQWKDNFKNLASMSSEFLKEELRI